jgi:hypothetical protein
VPFVLASRTEAVVAMDWTEFDGDQQSTIALHLITSHGRATPLIWLTVAKDTLKERRNEYEDRVLQRLRDVVPSTVRLTILADRGFGDQKLYTAIQQGGFDFVIRFRDGILVTSTDGEARTAREWLTPNGHARLLRNVCVTLQRTPVPSVVVVKAKAMKDPWALASSRTDLTASDIVKLYGKRFTIEENFRDTKDIRFGLGLSSTHIGKPHRRDRLLLLIALAEAQLTLLGAASEEVGLDRKMKANTSPKRTHSLFRQGCLWYACIPTMREEWLRPLMEAFGRLVSQHAVFSEVYGFI